MQVLLTRPLEDSRALAETLEGEGVETLIWPLTRVVPVAPTQKMPASTDGLLFTSANAVRALAALTDRRDLPALCVGDATQRVARGTGFRNCFSANGDARDLADLARRSGLRQFFHPRGRDSAGDLKEWLAASGQNVTEAVLYQAEEAGAPPSPVASAFAGGTVGLVTIWSHRNAMILKRWLDRVGADLSNTALLAISPNAAEPLARAGFVRVLIAETPGRTGMLAGIRSYSTPGAQ
jgi:uroporphyrinogen-III synthase